MILIGIIQVTNTSIVVSSNGLFVNKESKSKLAKFNLEFFGLLQVIVHLLAVQGIKNVSKSFDDLEVGVPIADKIKWEVSNSFLVSLWILPNLF